MSVKTIVHAAIECGGREHPFHLRLHLIEPQSVVEGAFVDLEGDLLHLSIGVEEEIFVDINNVAIATVVW